LKAAQAPAAPLDKVIKTARLKRIERGVLMKQRSMLFIVLSGLITGVIGFIASLFISHVPVVIVCVVGASTAFNISWRLIFDRRAEDQLRLIGNKSAEKEKGWSHALRFLSNIRKNSHELNRHVSESLDIAIITSGQIGENIRSVEKKTHGLHEKISDASSASEEITATINHCVMEMRKNEQSVAQTGAAIEEINANVRSVANITQQKTIALKNLKQVIESGAQKIGHTGRSIAEMTTLVKEISGVAQVINGIAAQTNLLSMNAAIEAAHAGDAGKGFAVVADEVRTLAGSSSINSKSIADSIKNIVSKIDEAKRASMTAGETFANIQNETNAFVDAFDEISHATSELSAGMDQILQAVHDIKEFSAQIAGGSKEMADGSCDIDAALRKMKDYSHEILNDMGYIAQESRNLTGSQSGISQYAVDNNKTMGALYKELEADGLIEKDGKAFDYELIVLMHRNWLAQLRAFIDERKEDLVVTEKDYLNCDLGKWIYGEGKQHQNNGHYRNLEQQHQKFHALAGEIYQAKKSGDTIRTEELYKSLMDEYKQVVSLLADMNKTLNEKVV
jgi:methyl-accepting chemotaxis protein